MVEMVRDGPLPKNEVRAGCPAMDDGADGPLDGEFRHARGEPCVSFLGALGGDPELKQMRTGGPGDANSKDLVQQVLGNIEVFPFFGGQDQPVSDAAGKKVEVLGASFNRFHGGVPICLAIWGN